VTNVDKDFWFLQLPIILRLLASSHLYAIKKQGSHSERHGVFHGGACDSPIVQLLLLEKNYSKRPKRPRSLKGFIFEDLSLYHEDTIDCVLYLSSCVESRITVGAGALVDHPQTMQPWTAV
jgi:hypothetical protein